MSKIIERLKELDLNTATDEEIYDLLSKIETFPLFTRTFHKGEIIVRSRPNDKKEVFNCKSDLIYPPNPTSEYGRANIKNTISFYGSLIGNDYYSFLDNQKDLIDAIVPTITEQRFFKVSNENSIYKITYGVWEVVNSFNVAVLVQNNKYRGKNNYIDAIIRDYDSYLLTVDKDMQKHGRIVTEYLCDEFFKKVPYEQDQQYRISAYFTERVYDMSFVGLIYPSTKMEGSGLNIVIKPEIVDNNLKLKRAGECTVYRYNGIDVSHDKVADNINADGSFSFDKEGNGHGHLLCLRRLGANNYFNLLQTELNRNNIAAFTVVDKFKKIFNINDDLTKEFFQNILDTVDIEKIIMN
ncbi:MAG: hypothetical protein PF574_01830 [Candidatus Delongbacteria bacterium]|jgi:hypothetical protein|nr:hypothetical protein [Candidatus Delongbacteria bacterium]